MRKWFHALTGVLLSILVFTGCNNDLDPPPPNGANQEDNKEDMSHEPPAVKEPTEKAEDLVEDGNEVSEEEIQRDRELEKNFEKKLENLDE